MRKFLATILLLAASFLASAQIQRPVEWTFSQRPSDDGTELIFRAKIADGWHIYALPSQEKENLVPPTEVVFDNLPDEFCLGQLQASAAAVEKFDKNLEMNLSFYENEIVFSQKISPDAPLPVSGEVCYMACSDETCLSPTAERFSFGGNAESVDETVSLPALAPIQPVVLPSAPDALPDYWRPVGDSEFAETAVSAADVSYWKIFLEGLLCGLLALFTPCVWPIIPMTVSFFLKRRNGRRDAFLYGISIVLIYTCVGMFVAFAFGAGKLTELSTSAVFNIACFLLLLVFAASFMGAFEIVLPSSWTTRLDAKAERTTGIVSIFLMAATLALISFSCTGPIVGTLLVATSVNNALLVPFVGMFGFALALAVPFTFFAMFPSWLSSLPKSGGWLNVVKVTLGFLELALSLKFLSVADLAYGWHILDRETFLALWIVIFALLGFYLLGKIRFPHDSEPSGISFWRFLAALVSLAFAVYMLPGLWGAPLKAVSAFAPPLTTQDFNLAHEQQMVFNDFDEGMAAARERKKPVLLDFSGYGCVNCRKMESVVLSDSRVRREMDGNFVQITLFGDDRAALAEPMSVTENGKPLTLTTVGQKWSYLQRHKFEANAQPYYVILDADGNLLQKPYSFSTDIEAFLLFLKQGMINFSKIK